MPAVPEALREERFLRYGRFLLFALPLVLSHLGGMIMQLVDAVFLSAYATEAMAAAVAAGLYAWCAVGCCVAVAGYVGTFVAQYHGAGQSHRIGPAVWQGLWFALVSSGGLLALAFQAGPLMDWVGHEEGVRALEARYFAITVGAGGVFAANAALAGFFAGRGDNVILMVSQLLALAANAVLDWVMIFGRWGCPALGLAGAAWASILACGLGALVLFLVMLRPRFRRTCRTLSGWRPDFGLFRRVLYYGAPQGFRTVIELLAWSLFLLFVGQLGTGELAVSAAAFRVNTLAFFPVLGISMAVSILVGQAQGAGRPEMSAQAMRRGLVAGQAWMVLAALSFVLFPGWFMDWFFRADDPETARLVALGTVLLVFVAVFSLFDNLNLVLMAALQGAGDTLWTMAASVGAHLTYAAVLLFLAWLGVGLMVYWTWTTSFVAMMAGVWLLRYRGGKWRTMRVIENVIPPVSESASISNRFPLP